MKLCGWMAQAPAENAENGTAANGTGGTLRCQSTIFIAHCDLSTHRKIMPGPGNTIGWFSSRQRDEMTWHETGHQAGGLTAACPYAVRMIPWRSPRMGRRSLWAAFPAWPRRSS